MPRRDAGENRERFLDFAEVCQGAKRDSSLVGEVLGCWRRPHCIFGTATSTEKSPSADHCVRPIPRVRHQQPPLALYLHQDRPEWKPSRKGNDHVDAEATFELRWEGTQIGFQMMIMMIPPTSNARRGTAAPSAIAAWHSQSHCCQHFMAPMDHDDCQRERSETSRKWGLAKT
jgi:hypothetical protein